MRKIVQIAFEISGGGEDCNESQLHVLCNDESIWYFARGQWVQWALPEIPQDDEKEIEK